MRLTKYTTAIAANYSPLAMQLYHIALGIVNNLFSFFPFFNLRLAAVREDSPAAARLIKARINPRIKSTFIFCLLSISFTYRVGYRRKIL